MQTISAMQMPRARGEELIVKECSDEVLVYDLKRHKAHCLNRTAALVWRQCDGQTSVAEMSKAIGEKLKAPVSEELIWLAVGQLGKAHLLQERIGWPAGESRRTVMRRLALATVVAPMITSIIAPAAAQAQTQCTVTNANCTSATVGCCCSGNSRRCVASSTQPDGGICNGPPCTP